MKIVAKILIIAIIVLALLVTIVCVRNYQIFKKIENAGNEFFNSSNYQIVSKDTMENKDYIYYKDNIVLIKMYYGNEDEMLDSYWKDYSSGEEICKEGTNYKETITELKKLATLEFSNKLLFDIITEEDDCYVVKRRGNGWETLYDKETGLPKKDRQVLNGKVMTETEYTFELNTVTDEMLEKPVPIPVE